MSLIEREPIPSGIASNYIKHKILHFFYLEELMAVYPFNKDHPDEHLKLESILGRYKKSLTNASRSALLLSKELKWETRGHIDEQQTYHVIITPEGKRSFLDSKYLNEHRKERRERINFWVMVTTQLGLLLIAIYTTYSALTDNNKLREEFRLLKRQVELTPANSKK